MQPGLTAGRTEGDMRYLKLYDDYIKRLANRGRSTGIGSVGIGSILLVTVPFLIAIVLVSAVFDTFGRGGAVIFWLRLAISIFLLIGLFYSGFRFVYYRNQITRE